MSVTYVISHSTDAYPTGYDTQLPACVYSARNVCTIMSLFRRVQTVNAPIAALDSRHGSPPLSLCQDFQATQSHWITRGSNSNPWVSCADITCTLTNCANQPHNGCMGVIYDQKRGVVFFLLLLLLLLFFIFFKCVSEPVELTPSQNWTALYFFCS